MSSLDNFPDWSVFSEREEVKLDTELVSPAAEIAVLLQRRQTALNEAEQALIHERHTWLDILARQAVHVAQLAIVLGRFESTIHQIATQSPESQLQLKRSYHALRIVKDQMLDELQRAGLQIEEPLGKRYEEVAEFVSVEGWRHHKDFTSEVVAEVREPIVRYYGAVVRMGCVVMGAPLEEEEFSEQEEREVHAKISDE